MTTASETSASDDVMDQVREIVSAWMRHDITAMRNVVAIMMRKGGAGKTSLTLGLADALVRFGLNVLIVDMDPQGNSSLGLGKKVVLETIPGRIGKSSLQVPNTPTIVEVLESGEPGVADEAIQILDWQYDEAAPFARGGLLRGRVGALGLISSYEALEALPSKWKPIDFKKLRRALREAEDASQIPPSHRWDIILIDTGIAQLIGVQAATAADNVVCVTQAQAFGTDAIPQTSRLVKDVRENYDHPDLEIAGLVWNEFAPRQVTERELAAQAVSAHERGEANWDAPIWPYEIPNLNVISKSQAAFAPISAFLASSNREPATRVCQVMEAVALRLLDHISHPEAAELRQAWHGAWPLEMQTSPMRKDRIA